MFYKIMVSFHKSVECPTSQELLDFQNNKLKANEQNTIREHICSCDFCGAEVEFYSHCPQVGEENISITEMPLHLYELAEALLTNKHKDTNILNKLLSENEGLTLKEA